MPKNKFSVKKRLQSFVHAFRGLFDFLSTEHNAWIHITAAFVVIIAGWYFSISIGEWMAVLICIGMVISAEAMNTSIEEICDFISPEKSEKIKKIKDMAAGAVLFVAIIAFIVGCIIFGPKIYAWR